MLFRSVSQSRYAIGKVEIYPQDNVEICLREEDETLQIKAQSKSKDAGIAKWHRVIAKKVGKKT